MGTILHPIIEEALEEHGYLAKWEAKWEGRARVKERLSIAQNLLGLGLPFETIVSATKLDPEKVKELYASENGTA